MHTHVQVHAMTWGKGFGEQPAAVSSLLPTSGLEESNSGPQVWQQVPLPDLTGPEYFHFNLHY